MKTVHFFAMFVLAALLLIPAAAFADTSGAYAAASGAHVDLKGAGELDWTCGVPWHDPGMKAFDADGTDRTADVVTEGEVIPWRPGD